MAVEGLANIKLMSDELVGRWNDSVAKLPILQLDYTWPSIGVLDLMSVEIRQQISDPRSQRLWFLLTSSYLAVIASEAWSAMDCKVSVEMTPEGVVITAKGGQFLTGTKTFTVNVTAALMEVFQNGSGQIPVLGGFSRIDIVQNSGVIAAFAAGLCLGLCPYGKGKWKDLTTAEFRNNIEAAELVLVRQCSDWYRRVYPDEAIGAVDQVYLSKMIFPPMLMGEPLPGFSAATAFVELVKEENLDLESVKRFSRNLAVCPHEHLRLIGQIFYFALCGDEPDNEVVQSASSLGAYSQLIRDVSRRVRIDLLGLDDWLYRPSGYAESDRSRYELDRRASLISWLVMPPEAVSDDRLRNVVILMAGFDTNTAIELLEGILETDGENVYALAQVITLYLTMQDLGNAEKHAQKILSNPKLRSNNLMQECLADVVLFRGGTEQALEIYEALFARMIDGDFRYLDVAMKLISTYILVGDTEKALVTCETTDGLREIATSLEVICLSHENRPDEAVALGKELLAKFPTCHPVFYLLYTKIEGRDSTILMD